VLGLVERVVTVGLGFGEKVTAGAENFPPSPRMYANTADAAQCGAPRLDRGCITDQGDERLGSWKPLGPCPGSTRIIGMYSNIIHAFLVKHSL